MDLYISNLYIECWKKGSIRIMKTLKADHRLNVCERKCLVGVAMTNVQYYQCGMTNDL